jgi:hypothetical protein
VKLGGELPDTCHATTLVVNLAGSPDVTARDLRSKCLNWGILLTLAEG